jgi:hypothetical protein
MRIPIAVAMAIAFDVNRNKGHDVRPSEVEGIVGDALERIRASDPVLAVMSNEELLALLAEVSRP